MGAKRERPRGTQRNGGRKVQPVVIDAYTGETLGEGIALWVPRKYRFRESYMLVMQRALLELADDRDAGYEATRVLLHMLGSADYENWVKVNQTEIGARLGIKRPNVGRALKALVAKGYLERAEARINGHHVYRINHDVAWKGKGKNWAGARKGDKPPPHLRLVKGAKAEE